MKNVIVRHRFDKKKQATSSTQGLLQLEVRVKGTNKTVLLSTDIKLYKHQFSDKNGFTCVKHGQAAAINKRVRDMFVQVEAFALSDKCTDIADVRNWDKVESHTYSVVEFIREDLKKRKVSSAVLETNNGLINHLEAFEKIKTFDDITYNNISDFDAHLRQTISSQPTLYKRHTGLKSYIVKAINSGLCTENPYVNFKVAKGKGKTPTFLTEDELREIEKHKPINEKISKTKDLFIFQCYTGLAYIDLMNFDKSLLFEVNERTVIRSNREKTDESFVALLLPKAKEILEKYDYELPKISNQKYNDYLKLLGIGAKLTKDLTSHVARHTFATYLINNDIPLESVSKALGHSTVKQTTHYARLLGKTVVKDMEKLLAVPEKKEESPE